MVIDILTKADINPNVRIQISELYKQLGGNQLQIGLNELLENHNEISLAYCRVNDQIVGIAILCHYTVISGKKGWIEDVVVNSQHRGQGIGRKLMNKLLEIGKEKKLSEILLFTEDHRIPAINLYSDLGFKIKDSRIYTFKINPD